MKEEEERKEKRSLLFCLGSPEKWYYRISMYKMMLIIRTWLMGLWRLGNPIICCLQFGDPGSQWCKF
jgi:hypothetical protein